MKKELGSNAEIWQRGFWIIALVTGRTIGSIANTLFESARLVCGDAKRYPYCSHSGGWDAVPQRLKPLELDAVWHG